MAPWISHRPCECPMEQHSQRVTFVFGGVAAGKRPLPRKRYSAVSDCCATLNEDNRTRGAAATGATILGLCTSTLNEKRTSRSRERFRGLACIQ